MSSINKPLAENLVLGFYLNISLNQSLAAHLTIDDEFHTTEFPSQMEGVGTMSGDSGRVFIWDITRMAAEPSVDLVVAEGDSAVTLCYKIQE